MVMMVMDGRRENIERWILKTKIKSLEAATGNENSLFSLTMPYLDQISRVITLLNAEYEKVSPTENNHNYLWAIDSAKKTMEDEIKKVHFNGVVLYTGTILKEEGREETLTTHFQPFKQIQTSVFEFGTLFRTEPLRQLLEAGDVFGFVVMDYKGASFYTLRGDTYQLHHHYDFPSHIRKNYWNEDAQSVFNRMNTYRSYYVEAAQLATRYYIHPSTSQPTVTWLILAASQDEFKDGLAKELPSNLQMRLSRCVKVTYGGMPGFIQAVNLSSKDLGNLRFMQEIRVIGSFFREVLSEEKMWFYGVDRTLPLILKSGAIKTLILYEDLDVYICVMESPKSSSGRRGRTNIIQLSKEQEEDIKDCSNEEEWRVVNEKVLLVEWLATEYTRFGFQLEIVTKNTPEGLQFYKSFNGIGGTRLNKDESDSEDGAGDGYEDGAGDGYEDCMWLSSIW